MVDVDILVTFGSITLEVLCVGCDSVVAAIWGPPWSPREASGLSESVESKDMTEDVFERFGATMLRCSSPLQETMRAAMR